MAKQIFFPLIVPAHNEEAYLDRTIQNIWDIDYPLNRYETIVVENGSEDGTYQVAKQYQKNNSTVHSLQEANKPTSLNLGLNNVCKRSEWALFLDADTVLGTSFLRELNNFLLEKDENRVVGTPRVLPLEDKSLRAKLWFRFDNWVHRLAKLPLG